MTIEQLKRKLTITKSFDAFGDLTMSAGMTVGSVMKVSGFLHDHPDALYHAEQRLVREIHSNLYSAVCEASRDLRGAALALGHHALFSPANSAASEAFLRSVDNFQRMLRA